MKRKVSDQIVEALQQAVERGVKQWLDENKQELLATTKQALIEAHRPAENPEPPVDDKLYLTPAQLAARWGFHVGSVLRRLRVESWPTVRVGRRVLIPVAVVEEYEAGATTGGRRTIPYRRTP